MATPAAPRARPDLVERAFGLMSHPRSVAALAVALAAGAAAALLLGPGEEAGAPGPLPAFLELDDPLHSWWVTLLLVMLFLCLLAFSLDRLPRQVLAVLRPSRRLTGPVERDLRGVRRLPAGTDASAEAGRVAAAFRERGFVPEASEEAGTRYLFAQRGRWARLGEWAALLGLLALLGGGVAGRLLEWDGTVELAEGATAAEVSRRAGGGLTARQPLPFAVRPDRIEIGAPAGAPATARAEVSLLDAGGREVRREVLERGRSARQSGFDLGLAAWRELPGGAVASMVLVDKTTGARRAVRAARGQAIQLGPVAFSVEDYSPAWRDAGPAVRVRRTEAGQSSEFWVSQARPDLDARDRPDRWALEFQGLRKSYAVTLLVARRPVTEWLLAAAGLLVGGAALALSGTHRRLWARVEPGAVALAWASHRPSAAFERAVEAIRRDLGPAAGGG